MNYVAQDTNKSQAEILRDLVAYLKSTPKSPCGKEALDAEVRKLKHATQMLKLFRSRLNNGD